MATKKKQTPSATTAEIMMAMRDETKGAWAKLLAAKRVGFVKLTEAIKLAQAYNGRFKAPGEVQETLDELKAKPAGLRGKPRASVGDTNEYKISNYNGAKKKAVAASVVVPLSMYEWAGVQGAKVKVFFDKNNVIITKG